MQTAQLAALPLLALAAFAAGNLASAPADAAPDTVTQNVSYDGTLLLQVSSNRGKLMTVPSDKHFVMTDFEILPIQGSTKFVALVEQPHKGPVKTRMSGEFVEQSRLYTDKRPRTDLVFEPGSTIYFAAHRKFTGATCFAYHVRGRLVPAQP